MSLGKNDWERLVREVLAKARNRTNVLNPFRLDARKFIYDVAIPDHMWKVIGQLRAMEACEGLFRTTSYAKTTFGLDGGVYEIRVSMPAHVEKPLDIVTPWENIHPKARDYIMLWTRRRLELHRDEVMFETTLGRIGAAVGTWGQVGRVCPELAPFFSPKRKARYLKRRARSRPPRLPDSVTIEIITRMREVITEAAMLPYHSTELHGPVPWLYRHS